MPREERLQALLPLLRRHRAPVNGSTLATALGTSLRTLCRDIAALREQGIAIEGEPGAGYVLRAEAIPPLRFSATEVEALACGAAWVAEGGEPRLAAAARAALARLNAVLPEAPDSRADPDGLPFGPGRANSAGEVERATIRLAIRQGRKLAILYRDPRLGEVRRMVWPFALEFLDGARVLAAWCEAEGVLRPFRTDRIQALALTEGRYPRPREALLRAWQQEDQAGRSPRAQLFGTQRS